MMRSSLHFLRNYNVTVESVLMKTHILAREIPRAQNTCNQIGQPDGEVYYEARWVRAKASSTQCIY